MERKANEFPACVRRKTWPRPQASSAEDLIGRKPAQTGREPIIRMRDASGKRVWTLGRECREERKLFAAHHRGKLRPRSRAFRLRRSGNGQNPKSGSGEGPAWAFH